MLYLIGGLSSFVVAITASILGLGGSFMLIPVFLWLGFEYKHSVIPMALLLNLVTSFTAQTSYIKKKLTDTRIALIMSVAAVIFAQVGVLMHGYLETKTLLTIFTVLITVAAIDIIFFNKKKPAEEEEVLNGNFKINVPLIIIGGAFSGVMSGLLGIGGGFIIMPILLILGHPPRMAAATSSMVVFFSSTSALIGHLKTQQIDLNFALVCMVCVIIGAKTGALIMSEKCSPLTVKRSFGIIMMIIAVKFLIDTF